MGGDVRDEAVSFSEDLRATLATMYEALWPAINDERWLAAARAGREILHALREYPDAALPTPVQMERAWSYFALGVEAKEAGRLREAISLLQRAADVLPGQWWPSATARALWVQYSVHEELGESQAAIAALRRLLDLLHNDPRRRGPVWFAIGCSHERRGERQKAITAYSEALEQHAGSRLPGTPDWRHKARAAIVRCQLAEGRSAGVFWDLWWRSGWAPRLVFGIVALTAAVLFAASVWAVARDDYLAAGWWVGLFGALILVLLLPAIRRVSGHGFAVELWERSDLAFAMELKDAPRGADLPRD